MSYTATIGLEVHAELNTKSKMFCGCKNAPHDALPNTHVCPVCLAHPGTLPVPNEEAIARVLLFGEVIGATAATYAEFDRKNYFYPDIPKAYQISQYAYPFLQGGELLGVTLTRVHLEEDTARSQHDKGDYSIVDFNRAGVPLMELVTEPVIHDAETAGAFARELQLVLRSLGISEANMERGEMRVEANISISNTDTFGTKVEVKNLNSFKAVEAAIKYEINRHRETLESGETITQETRGWDEAKQKTFSQRSKETAKDYRYFPDPDLPKIDTATYSRFSKPRLHEISEGLPSKKRVFYQNLGLPRDQIETLVWNFELESFLRSTIAQSDAPNEVALPLANYLLTDVAPLVSENSYNLSTIKPDHFLELIELVQKNEIGSRVAKDLIPSLFNAVKSPRRIAEAENLLQVSDASALEVLVTRIIDANTEAVTQYRNGKEPAIKFLVGQGMKESKGTANPTVLEELLRKALL